MRRAGGSVLAVSVDPPDKSRKMVEKNRLPFDILCDEGARTIKEYGLAHHEGSHGDIALPANFLIDRDGRVVWRHLAGRVQDRCDPEDVLKVVRKHLGRS